MALLYSDEAREKQLLRHFDGSTGDVVLQLVLARSNSGSSGDSSSSGDGARPAKRARTNDQQQVEVEHEQQEEEQQQQRAGGQEQPGTSGARPPQRRVLREIRAHRMLLIEGSTVLASRLEGPWSEAQPQGVVDVLLESEEEEEAAVLVLKTMYCPRAEEAPLQGQSQQTLLQVLRLADQLGAEHCMAAACTALHASAPLDWATATAVYDLPTSCANIPACAALLNAASATVLSQLGDLDAAWQDDRKAQRLLGLPYGALKRLLADDRTCAYEETVIYTLAAWLEANPSCSDKERNALGALLRLPHANPLYLATIASRLLPKLVPLISAPDVAVAAAYHGVTPNQQRQLSRGLSGGKFKAWSLPQRPASSCGNVLECKVPLSQLRSLHAQAVELDFERRVRETLPPRLIFKGLSWGLKLTAVKRSDGVHLHYRLFACAPPGFESGGSAITSVKAGFEMENKTLDQRDWLLNIGEDGGGCGHRDTFGLEPMFQWDEVQVRSNGIVGPDGKVLCRCIFAR